MHRLRLLFLLCPLLACAHHPSTFYQKGLASWYGKSFHGLPTASGEIFNMYDKTAAHRTLPFGTLVDVYCPKTGKTVRVKINDRGPFIRGRIIDLSYGAAKALGIAEMGVAPVELYVQGKAPIPPSPPPQKGEKFVVQAGAFQNRDNAQRFTETLRQTFSSVFTEEINGFVRVLIGPFPSEEEAQKNLEKLRNMGYEGLIRSVVK